jgi:hypothetical protein
MTSKEIQEHSFKDDSRVYAEGGPFQNHVQNFWLREIAYQLAKLSEFLRSESD